jgi:hypothetical protein
VQRADTGQVTIIYGSQVGLLTVSREGVPPPTPSQIWHQSVAGVADTAEAGDLFGAAVASGHFNDDDFSDLAVLVPGERNASGEKRGAIQVLFGSESGLI